MLSPITSRIAVIQNLKPPESKTDVLSVLGAMGFYANYNINHHVCAKPLCDLVKNESNFEWLDSHQQVLDKLKAKFKRDCSVAIANLKYPFHIHAVSSNLGTCNMLIQQFPKGNGLFLPTPVYSVKENRKFPHNIENCAE